MGLTASVDGGDTRVPEDESAPSIQLSDYRRVGAASFPHRIRFLESGRLAEEWNVSIIEVNQPIAGELFEARRK